MPTTQNVIRQRLGGIAMLLAGLAALAGAQEVHVRMYRPGKVGDVYTIEATGESSTLTSLSIDVAAAKETQEKVSVKLAGTVEVMAVDAGGQATKLRCTLRTCAIDGKPAFPDGAVVVADNLKGHVEFTVKGEQVSGHLAKALALALHPHDPEEGSSGDEVMGDDQPRQPGDTWAVNTAAIAKRLNGQGIHVEPDNLSGQVSLKAQQQDGHAVMVLESDETGTGLEATLKNGVMMENGTFKVHSSLTTPPQGGYPKTDTFVSERTYRETGVTPDHKGFTADVTIKRSGSKTLGEPKAGK